MSGIAGIYDLGGRPLDRKDLRGMMNMLSHRGTDGRGTVSDDSIVLGHRSRNTTPESLSERLPLVRGEEDLILTADARIDNRSELIRALDLRRGSAEPVTDSELILSAYEKWGDECPKHLVGAFAFAIWDARRRRLFCARDHAGIRPFYYCLHSTRRFILASELQAIFEGAPVSRALNDTRVVDYLAGIITDSAYTFYRDILRLPPAHAMTVTRKGVTVWKYWSVDQSLPVRLSSDREYVGAFREIFTEAVRCRMRSAVPIGSALSGGLDSSSVTCTAAEILAGERTDGKSLHTFSVIFERFDECDERDFINAVRSSYDVRSHFVQGDGRDVSLDQGMTELLSCHQEPHTAPNAVQSLQLYGLVEAHGVGVLLHGHGGDETVSIGRGYLKELACEKRWWTLTQELAAEHLNDPGTFAELWAAYIRYGLEQQSSRHRVARILTATALRGAVLMHRHLQDRETDSYNAEDVLDDRIKRETDFTRRYEKWKSNRPSRAESERERHRRTLATEYRSIAFEELDRLSQVHGVDTRFPLWDKRIVEFCTALPPNQKRRRGRGRSVMRRAMVDILPEAVRMRRDKTDFSSNLTDLVRSSTIVPELKRFVEKCGVLNRYVHAEQVKEACRKLEGDDPPMSLVFQSLRIFAMGRWLQINDYD